MKNRKNPLMTARALPNPAARAWIIASSVLLMAGLLFFAENAFGAAAGPSLGQATKNISVNVAGGVKIVPMLSYVIGTFFALSGLLKLKDWVNDGERNPLGPVIIRLLVATLLILLPHMMRITSGTFFGESKGLVPTTPAPRLNAFCKSGANC